MLALSQAYRLGALTSALAIAAGGMSMPAAAQGTAQRPGSSGSVARPSSAPQATISQPVVQPLPGKGGMTLDAALGRLARDPRDVDALIDAGNAALAMGDVDAATGFFRRADQVSPGNPRAKAGLAGAMVRSGDPFGAIPLFDEAEKAGALDGSLAADRGLAYDLVGDNATAQRYYREAQARTPGEEVSRRLALSYAISGDKQNAEVLLSPLLQRRDLAAWRTRAFALAILGQTEEAVNIANSILPAELAAGIAPYLRYMPRLTRAQQAAAANLGAFPRASEIGRDDPRVAQYAPRTGSVAAVDTALTPQGEPLGRTSRTRRSAQQAASRSAQQAASRAAPPEPLPARQTGGELAAVAPVAPAPPAAAPPVSTAPPVVAIPAPAPAPTPAAPPPAVLAVSPGFTIAAAPASPPPAPRVSPPPAPPVRSVVVPAAKPAAAPPPRRLAEVFAEFARPSTDATPAAGAVDLRRIKPARPKPPEPPAPPPPSHPSRVWVQVATGRDKAALGYDWRRMTREKAQVFRGMQPFVSAWGRTNRLLTGPFRSEAEANSFIAQLRRADIDGAFTWTSPAGQAVDALPAATKQP